MGNGRSDTSNVRRNINKYMASVQEVSSSYQQPLLDPISQKETQIYDEEIKEEVNSLDIEALIRQLNGFFAVVWPICITILLASIVACNVTDKTTQRVMSSYMYYQNIESNTSTSTSVKTLHALINGLFVIGLIACFTFGIVFLYQFNCIKYFHIYCILYSTVLLGFSGGKLIGLILSSYAIILDRFSYLFVMYNFAFVGTLSIFYQKGIPMFIEQAYLVLTSVIVAWQLCQLPEWSVWALLLLLALWDFFAVMSPIGPLKWLIQLIQDKGTPLPGLLFEANINQNAHLVGWTTKTTATNSPTTTKTTMTTPSMTKNPTNGCSGTSTNNIHIGLGDFIFYSVLAGRAAIHGMTVFTVCFINLIMGLAITMYLLAKYEALPALPIPILLAIGSFFLATIVICPMIDQIIRDDGIIICVISYHLSLHAQNLKQMSASQKLMSDWFKSYLRLRYSSESKE